VADRKQIIQKAYDLGFEYEKNYGGCAQCVMAAIQDATEIRNDYIFKAGSGLAGGAGLKLTGLCGGYSGSVMLMSAFFGRVRSKIDGDMEEKVSSLKMAAALNDKYVEKYGSVICRQVQKKIFGRSYDLWDPAEKQLFEEAGGHVDKCTTVVADAAGWATGFILDEIEKRGLSLAVFVIVVALLILGIFSR
jgi:C_GCAxxG_C_C family probable redox protein